MSPDELIDLYINLKRIFYNKPIARPKPETIDYDNLTRLAVLLNERDVPCDDFLLVNVRAYKYKNVFPKTAQLLGIKALNRYSEYANKKYKKGNLFRTDPHSVLIYSTNVYYPIADFLKPFEQDQKVITVWVFAREGKTEFDTERGIKVWEIYQYTLAKYEWMKQTPPDSLLEWGKKLEEVRNEKTICTT